MNRCDTIVTLDSHQKNYIKNLKDLQLILFSVDPLN